MPSNAIGTPTTDGTKSSPRDADSILDSPVETLHTPNTPGLYATAVYSGRLRKHFITEIPLELWDRILGHVDQFRFEDPSIESKPLNQHLFDIRYALLSVPNLRLATIRPIWKNAYIHVGRSKLISGREDLKVTELDCIGSIRDLVLTIPVGCALKDFENIMQSWAYRNIRKLSVDRVSVLDKTNTRYGMTLS